MRESSNPFTLTDALRTIADQDRALFASPAIGARLRQEVRSIGRARRRRAYGGLALGTVLVAVAALPAWRLSQRKPQPLVTSATSLGAGTMVPLIAVDSGDLIQTVPSTALVYTAHNASVTMINSRLFSWPILPVTVASNMQYAMQLAQTNVMAEGNEIKELTLRERQGFTVLCANSWALGQFGVYAVVTVEVNS